jgi:hypothetical protein
MPRNLISSDIRDFSEEQEVTATGLLEQDEHLFDKYLAEAREILTIKVQKATLDAREIVLKKTLMEILEKAGEPYGPNGQHRTIAFPAPIKGFARLVRQTKVSDGVDEVKAEAVARQKGIYDRLFKPVMALDQSAVMVAVEEGLITERELEDIFPRRVSYAFVPEKAKK